MTASETGLSSGVTTALGTAPSPGAVPAPAPSPASRALRLVVLGRQGSGKGTQAVRLAECYGVPHISTGDAFRSAVRSGSELGAKAKVFMETGELVPDDLTVGIVEEYLAGAGQHGFILDGFPRNVRQAEALARMLAPARLDVVVNLEVSTEEVLRRLAGRRVCTNCGANYNVVDNPPSVPGRCDVCGGAVAQRADDTEEAIRQRLEIYESATAPLVDWYKEEGLLATVDATGDPDLVTERVVAAIDAATGSL
ncbi:MAG TPA: adenylate kinase [Acidimicrobiales bacterium]|nr:adenylate kinase [Acidimicrobiales bacterium]